MANQKRPTNINEYRKSFGPNIGVIIFAVMFIYIIICIIMFFSKGSVGRYEVRSGSLSVSNVYNGIILRQENIITADSPGYVNYFAREGEHIAVGDLIYTVDQSGRIAEILKDDDSEILLSGNDLYELRGDFVQFAHNYSDESFGKTYDFSYDMEGAVLKISNYNMLNNLQLAGTENSSVKFCYAPRSGIVIYSTDGYEEKTPGMITMEDFTSSDDAKEQYVNNQLVEGSDAVYKIVTSEQWSIVIPVENERIPRLQEEQYVEIKFLKNQYTSWAKVNVLGSADDDNTFVELQFNNSMITFAKDRLAEIEIIMDDDIGLKIPNSAIVEKEFYLIPKKYMTKGGNSSADGFMRETYNEEGQISTQFTEVTIYSESDTDYYVDTAIFNPGDYICDPESGDKYPISKVGTLVGVYNINKGFADFKEITILYSNDEYSIVKSNTRYGLTEYDYIVLDAESIDENDFIYE